MSGKFPPLPVDTAPSPTVAEPSPVEAFESPLPQLAPEPLAAQAAQEPASQAPETQEPQTAAPTPAPKARLKDLIDADPDYRREYDGLTGERLRVERQRAGEKALADQAAKAEVDRQAWEQNQVNQELAYRQSEDNQLAVLTQAGDTYALEAFTKGMLERRGRVDAYYNATQAERKRVYEMEQAATHARSQEAATWQKSIEADFYSLPVAIRTELSGKQFHGADIVEARAAYQAAVRKAVIAHEKSKWEASLNDRVAADVAKASAKQALSEPSLSTSTGMPPSGTFPYMEDAEAAFVRHDITKVQMMALRASGLKYRADG